jgi:hypothetical protein
MNKLFDAFAYLLINNEEFIYSLTLSERNLNTLEFKKKITYGSYDDEDKNSEKSNTGRNLIILSGLVVILLIFLFLKKKRTIPQRTNEILAEVVLDRRTSIPTVRIFDEDAVQLVLQVDVNHQNEFLTDFDLTNVKNLGSTISDTASQIGRKDVQTILEADVNWDEILTDNNLASTNPANRSQIDVDPEAFKTDEINQLMPLNQDPTRPDLIEFETNISASDSMGHENTLGDLQDGNVSETIANAPDADLELRVENGATEINGNHIPSMPNETEMTANLTSESIMNGLENDFGETIEMDDTEFDRDPRFNSDARVLTSDVSLVMEEPEMNLNQAQLDNENLRELYTIIEGQEIQMNKAQLHRDSVASNKSEALSDLDDRAFDKDSLEYIAENTRKLETESITDAQALDKDSLEYIAENTRKLETESFPGEPVLDNDNLLASNSYECDTLSAISEIDANEIFCDSNGMSENSTILHNVPDNMLETAAKKDIEGKDEDMDVLLTRIDEYHNETMNDCQETQSTTSSRRSSLSVSGKSKAPSIPIRNRNQILAEPKPRNVYHLKTCTRCARKKANELKQIAEKGKKKERGPNEKIPWRI